MKVKITDIKWDTDLEDDVDVDLPTEITVPLNEIYPNIDNNIADFLSDKFGFCLEGFAYDIEKE